MLYRTEVITIILLCSVTHVFDVRYYPLFLQELKLRRNTVLLLAFLASSGKAGFEILISNKLHTESNFLTLILQVVVSEVEQEKKVPEPVEILEER